MKILKIVSVVLLWLLSLSALALGVLFISIDTCAPMQDHSLAWRGWSNFYWVWLYVGLPMVVLAFLINPLFFKVLPKSLKKAPAYIAFSLACFGALSAAIYVFREARGYNDLDIAYEASTNKERQRLLLRAAGKGSAVAAYNAAILFQHGTFVTDEEVDPSEPTDRVPVNIDKAADYYRMAADQGLPESQLNLALLYFAGMGLPEGVSEAKGREMSIRLMEKASQAPDDTTRTLVADRLAAACLYMTIVYQSSLPADVAAICRKTELDKPAEVALAAGKTLTETDMDQDTTGGGSVAAPTSVRGMETARVFIKIFMTTWSPTGPRALAAARRPEE